jgi:rhamnulokinase
MTCCLAIDIGASSGRHIVGTVENGKIKLKEVYRFDNTQIRKDGHDCWDKESLFKHVVAGIKACGDQGYRPSTIGIDTWGVDFVLLDKDMKECSDTVAYRDARTTGMDDVVSEVISPEDLYSRTGIQKMLLNTIYQLAALKKENPNQLEKAEYFLMIPEYLNFRLTGKALNEYTNASTTNLLNAAAKEWDRDLISSLGLPQKIFGKLEMPGTLIGNLLPKIANEVGFDAKVILPATHDTGSAFLAVPARDDKAVFLSSGTWSLLGVENEKPITSEKARKANFTNEGGAWGRYRFLKNIMGLWMIQSIRRELNGVEYVEGKGSDDIALAQLEDLKALTANGEKLSYADLERLARESSEFEAIIDVNDSRFLSPSSMVGEVLKACEEAGQPKPVTVGKLMKCVYVSLAKCYAKAIEALSEITEKKYTSINIVGGGSRDGYLNELVKNETGLDVFAGPTEGTAIGNLAVQFIASGEFSDISAVRKAIADSFEVKEV